MNSWTRHLAREAAKANPPVIAGHVATPDTQAYYGHGFSPAVHSINDGEKFAGGFGLTQLLYTDYWTLRKRSAQLFEQNLYARGIVRRLVTNEINTGLTPEAAPDEDILGLNEDALADWSEDVETRFGIWGKSPQTCDYRREKTFGAIQRQARLEALVGGDVLVVLRQSRRTNTINVQLIRGESVQNPIDTEPRRGNVIKHGVEMDATGRHVAYHVSQKDGHSQRVPAYGEKSGRRIAWLVYGTDKRMDDVRGQPLLSLMLQSLREIDRYRDSAQRKAVVNSILAMFIKKTEDKPGTLPITGAAVRNTVATTTDSDATPRNFNISNQVPGVVLEELQTGEEPVGFNSQGTDVNFGTFEEAILQTVAWANEMPPEILRLAFSNNYSASQAAINEFKIYLNKVWTEFGEDFCAPIYQEWLVNEALKGAVRADGLLDAWRDPLQYTTLGAWMAADWYGSIKPSTDMLKQVKASELLVAGGFSTRARETRITTGTKFSRNIKRLRRENAQLAEVLEPLAEEPNEAAMAAEAIVDEMEARDHGARD